MVIFFQQLGLNQDYFTLSQVVYFGAHFLANPVCGWIADRYSRPNCIVLGNFLTAIAFVWYGFTSSILEILLVEALLGIGAAFYVSATVSLVASYAETEDRSISKAYTRLAAMSRLSVALLVAIGGWVGASNPRYALFFSAILYLLAGCISLCLKEVRDAPSSQGTLSEVLQSATQEIGEGIGTLRRNKRTKWLILIICTSCQIGYGLLWVQSALYAQAGVPAELIGLAWALFFVPDAMGSYILEFFVDRWRTLTLILVPSLCSFAAMATMAASPSIWTIGLFTVIGLASGWLNALSPVLIQRDASSKSLAFTKAIAQNVNFVLYLIVTFAVGRAATQSPQASIVVNIGLLLPLLLLCGWKLYTTLRIKTS